MCGIAGICRRDGRPIPENWVTLLDNSIKRRGPDAARRFHDQVGDTEVILLHRRLSIIDHAGGGQPMVSYAGESPDVAMVFNGCVYNNGQLRKELSNEGAVFASDHSDSETLFHAYTHWGEEMPSHIDGMYAVAFWDRRTLQLTLMRDPYGQKPLYVLHLGEAGDGCIFCSNPAPLQQIARELSLQQYSSTALQRYLQLGYMTDCDTLIQPVQSVQKARVLLKPTDESIEGAIRGSVIDHLESDVPLGCFLSGGLDSSLIATFAQQELGNLKTYCVKMDDPAYDESQYAKEVAKHLGTTHETLRVSMDPANDLLNLMGQLGQPFADSSILPTYWVSRAAREEVSVALSGDGGDELFLGYNRYLAIQTLARWHWLVARFPLQGGTRPKTWLQKLARMSSAAKDWSSFGVASIASIFSRDEIELLTGEPFVDPIVPLHGESSLSRLQQFDIEKYLEGDLLRKVDVASMYVALEVRCPLLSMRVRNAVSKLTTRELISGGRKSVLKTIAKKYLPEQCVERPKMGFAVPLASWLRSDQSSLGQLAGDTLLCEDAFSGLNINKKFVASMLHDHRSGRRNFEHKLFALLTLALWAQQPRTRVPAG
ncbi:MAG: asparagine synthase (glutamine-hydrolyzing) [Phycisphaerales bacterium]|jgi:asparagine synthase (glutamine-hydrolysing)|nr:asparagine synthase (glutamine-hydrolyzing) [Phycisphaerales bacterium]